MQFVINNSTLRAAWGSATEYWFSRVDYSIHSSSDLQCDDDTKMVEAGFVPFVTVGNEEVIRAYIKSLNNPKVSYVFEKLNSEECVETFWKYFNAYPDISSGFDDFQTDFVIKKVTDWCEENGIDYKIED